MPVWEQLATDQFDPQHMYTLYSLLGSTVFVVVSRVGCLGVTGVNMTA